MITLVKGIDYFSNPPEKTGAPKKIIVVVLQIINALLNPIFGLLLCITAIKSKKIYLEVLG